jgi:hypothetical protein
VWADPRMADATGHLGRRDKDAQGVPAHFVAISWPQLLAGAMLACLDPARRLSSWALRDSGRPPAAESARVRRAWGLAWGPMVRGRTVPPPRHDPARRPNEKRTTVDVAARVVGLVATLAGAATALAKAPAFVALACLAVGAGLSALDVPRWRIPLGVAALVLTLAVAALLLVPDDRDGPSALAVRQWDRWPTDLASATDPTGFFPARPGLRCNGSATCGAGNVPVLNSLVFGAGGFLQGIPDERRFLDAEIVRAEPALPVEDLRPMHDPLRVAPGDRVEISGIADNAGTPGAATATARNVRALIALPEGNGTNQSVLSSVSALNSDPSAVSDSVRLMSKVPIYLRYEPGTASVSRVGSPSYRLPDRLITTYDPYRFDRRELAGHGVRVGCARSNGVLPSGRACALRYKAVFDVRYAAMPDNVNGVGAINSGTFEVGGTVRGKGDVWLYWSPRWGALSDLTARGGSFVYIDCFLSTKDSLWYHVSTAAPVGRGTTRGWDTAFIPARAIVGLHDVPSDCIS